LFVVTIIVAILHVPFGKGTIESQHRVHREEGGGLLVTLERGDSLILNDIFRLRTRDAATGKQLARRSTPLAGSPSPCSGRTGWQIGGWRYSDKQMVLGTARDLIWVHDIKHGLSALRASTLEQLTTQKELERTHKELAAGLTHDQYDFDFDERSGGVRFKTSDGGRFVIKPHTFEVIESQEAR